VQHANEWMLFCKIKSNDYANVEAAIRAAHTYSNPEIVEVEIQNGAQAYLAWIAYATRDE
jgi:periplasmic divalent cation tolerance protein